MKHYKKVTIITAVLTVMLGLFLMVRPAAAADGPETSPSRPETSESQDSRRCGRSRTVVDDSTVECRRNQRSEDCISQREQCDRYESNTRRCGRSTN